MARLTEKDKSDIQQIIERNIQEMLFPLPAKEIRHDKRPPIPVEIEGMNIGIELHPIMQQMAIGFSREDPTDPEDTKTLIVDIPTDLREERLIKARAKFLLPSTRLDSKIYKSLEKRGLIEKLPKGMYHMEHSSYKIEEPAYVIKSEEEVKKYLQKVLKGKRIAYLRCLERLSPEERKMVES